MKCKTSFIQFIEYRDMIDEAYLEEDRMYFHEIYNKEDKPSFVSTDAQQN